MMMATWAGGSGGAKPGMGFDEGCMIVRNEMARISAILRARENA